MTQLASMTKELSLEALVSAVREAVWDIPPLETDTYYIWADIYGIYPDYVIISEGLALYKVSYEVTNTGVVLADRSTWEQVEPEFVPSVSVMKDKATGSYRWLGITSSAYKDQDGEHVSAAALARDVQRSDEDGKLGPLRWWHIGAPNSDGWLEEKGQPWGHGVDIGDCDWRMAAGPFLFESGTFHDKALGEAVAKSPSSYAYSIGFHHPPGQPDEEGVYQDVFIFERSLLPAGKASNLLTATFVTKEDEMDNVERLKTLEDLVGSDTVSQLLDRASKATDVASQLGLTMKMATPDVAAKTAEDDVPDAPPAPGPEPTPTPDEPAVAETKAAVAETKAAVAGTKADSRGVTVDALVEALKASMAPLQQKQTDALAAVTQRLDEVTARLDATEASLKEALDPGVPRGIRYRASSAKGTVQVKGKGQAPSDPWLDAVTTGTTQKAPPA